MKRLPILVLLPVIGLFYSCGENAIQPQAGNNIQFIRYFGGPGDDEAADLKVLPNGDLLISGSLAPESLSEEFVADYGGGGSSVAPPYLPTVMQVSPEGDLRWQSFLRLPNRLKEGFCIYPELKAVASDVGPNGEVWTVVDVKTDEQFGIRGDLKGRLLLYKTSNGAEVIDPVFINYQDDFSFEQNCDDDDILLEVQGIAATSDGGALVCANYLNTEGSGLYQLMVFKVAADGMPEGVPFILSDEGELESFGIQIARLGTDRIAILTKEGQWTGNFESLDSKSRLWLFDESGQPISDQLFPAGRVGDFGYADIRQTMSVHESGISLMEVVYHPDGNSDSVRIWELNENLGIQSRIGFAVPTSFFLDYLPLPIELVRVPGNGYACTFTNPGEGLIRAWRFDDTGTQLDTLQLGIPGPNQAVGLQLKPGTGGEDPSFYLLHTMQVATQAMITLMEIQDWKD